jgi:hypothetical protein
MRKVDYEKVTYDPKSRDVASFSDEFRFQP